MTDWHPTASVEILQKRAALLAGLRTFFSERSVLEVDIPVLAPATVTDPNIDSFSVTSPVNSGERYFLMPSPEFYMKRLLAAGCGSVYSMGHAFRAGDTGSCHQPEFTMLEWYRPNWTLAQLAEEVKALIKQFIDLPVKRASYRDVFLEYLGVDPHCASLDVLKKLSLEKCSPAFSSDDKSVWLDLLFSHIIEPELTGIVFLNEFPEEQAALAKLQQDAVGNTVADRFEVYINGIEIANAYQEETDADVLEKRFLDNKALRASRGQGVPEIDQLFLDAMRAGLPSCAGVALGVDRLFMALLDERQIANVLPFAK